MGAGDDAIIRKYVAERCGTSPDVSGYVFFGLTRYELSTSEGLELVVWM